MRNPAFSAVTTDLINSYGLTVKNLVQAYRAGGERVADFVEQRWALALGQSQDQLTAEVRKNAKVTHDLVGAIYHRSLAFTTSSADAAVDKLVALASQGVQHAAANAARFDEQIGVPSLDKLAQVAVPAAVAATRLVNQLEEKSGAWAQQISASQPSAAKRPSAFAKARARRAA